ncbi:unnamed protein product [Rhizophagus irregularis]|nr:unnamed protein product [Rhizophagus irregularis]
MVDIYKEDITNDFQQFSEEDYNVIIYAGEEPNIKELHAHSIILRCRSQYFRAAFSPNWAKKSDGTYILKKPNISGTTFQIILRYIYSGRINYSQIEKTEYLELLKAADELIFDRIVDSLQDYLIKNQNEYLKQDPIGILQLIFPYKQFIPLRDFLVKLICQKAGELFESERFLTLPPQILELLFKQDNITLDEVDIWDYLIKWSHAQNPTIGDNPLIWTNIDFEIMKQTMGNLISLIKFRNIPSKDFFDKVHPYKKLLSENILQLYSISSPKTPKLKSNIITKQKDLYYSLFLNWINKRDMIYKTREFIQYDFKPILHIKGKSQISGDRFHFRCDGKGATIVIAKIKNSNKLVGGYNPLDWQGKGSKSTSDSFIFSFDDHKNVNSGKIGRVIHNKRAVRCFRRWGPIFGAYNKVTESNDLMMRSNGEWFATPTSYPNLNIPSKFDVDSYEVFQVIRE